MPKYKVSYSGPFAPSDKIIDADDLEDAEGIAENMSVYRHSSVEETWEEVD